MGSTSMSEAGGPAAGVAEGAAAAADGEDVLVVPASWRRVIHPRRGGVPGPALTLKPGPWTEQELGATPAAAATFALRTRPTQDADLCAFVDAWVRRRGIVFAAAATLELARDMSTSKARFEATARMRRLLAAAGADEYTQVVAALAECRGDFDGRLLASYLLPTEAAWTDEVLAEPYGDRPGWYSRILPYTLSTPGHVVRLGPGSEVLHPYWSDLGMLATVAEALGAAALPLLLELLADIAYVPAQARRAAYAVIAQLPSDESFEALVGRLGEKYVPAAALEAMTRFPRRSLRLLAATATGGTAAADAARRLLAGHVLGHAELVEAILAAGSLPEADAALIASLAGEAAGRPVAGPEQLPALLLAPPWTRQGAAAGRAEPAVLTGIEPAQLSRIDWAVTERAGWLAWSRAPKSPDWESAAKAYAESGFPGDRNRGLSGENLPARDFLTHAPEELARPLLPKWQPDTRYWNLVELFGPVLARFEQEALPFLLPAIQQSAPAAAGPILQPLVHPAVARMMADWLARSASVRGYAVSWLTRHPADAALLLIPDALGRPAARRAAAQNALRLIAPLTDVREAAARYGPDAVVAVEQVLDFDPLDLHPRRMPTAPNWLAGTYLPQILLRGRAHALPAESTRHVLSMLAISKPDAPYPGLEVVRELADGTSLAGFGWALFEAWQAADLPAKDNWVLPALGWFGDDDTARRLAPLIRAWPAQGGHQRAVAGLDVLAAIGTDAALRQLHQIAQKARFKGLQTRAQEKIAEIARALDLTAEQLADRLVPDFGLDEEGGRWLDYGPRRFRVDFDERLRPYVVDQAGVPRKTLPPPNGKDDAELAAAARKQFSGLKKDVRAVADGLVRRLESGMVTGRRWSAAEFRDLLLGHPLVGHLARRLVWLAGSAASDPAAQSAFRVAEDGAPATVEGKPFVLAEGAQIRLAHPIHLGGELAAWVELFADHAIAQPFPQLGRPVRMLTGPEGAATRLTRFEGVTVPVGRVLGLVRRGWRRGTPRDAGVEITISRELGPRLHAVIDLDPGIAVGSVEALGDQTLRKVYLSREPSGSWSREDEAGLRFDRLDPITASELIGDLTTLTS